MPSNDRPGAILVVDDDDCVRRVVKAFLEAAGYTVMSAPDGVAGLAFYQQNRPEIGLLLTDVAMPNMSGLDLADRVLEIDRELPVLFMSGTASGADRGHGCMEKPFLVSELLARVGAALHHEAARAPLFTLWP
jgi:two-component system, OmpR family, response regulator ResD